MAVLQLAQNFVGANTQKNPKTNLPDGIGVDARNLDTSRGDLRGIKACDIVHTLTGLGVQQISAYRMGRDTASKTQYWITRSVDADFCRSLIAEDTTERTYSTDGTKPKYTDNTLLGSPPYPTSWVDLGVPAPDAAMTATETTPGTGTEEERVYIDTFVRANGDESAPGVTRSITCNPNSVVTLNGFDSVPGGSHGITKRRIYVSIDGGEFQRVTEITTGTASYVDTGTRGLVLQTGGSDVHPAWLTPPDNLIGLIELWNDMIGGFVGKSYRICEAGHPHAWPIEYEGVLPDTIVGSAKFGTTWVLATTGQAYTVSGSTPMGMRDSPTHFKQACVSKRSVTSVGHGVCWAGKFGLCYYGAQGAGVITEAFIDRDTWAALDPTSIIGASWGDYYIGFYYDGANRKGFMVNARNPQGVIWIDQGAYGVFFDTVTDTLFLLDSAFRIREWYSGSATNVTFKTEKTRAAVETNPSVAMVVATTYPVTWKLYADGALKHTQTVTSREPFRLPGGYVARDFQQEISAGTGPIEACVLAEEMLDLP
jgi:hypothetical protein